MFDLTAVKGIIFDYGGTIDSNGTHWAEVLWKSYMDHQVPVSKEQFREAYVYGERYLATHPVIEPQHNFYDLLKIKVELQFGYLLEKEFLTKSEKSKSYILDISGQCYTFVQEIVSKEKSLLSVLKQRYPIVLVSNFYGNVGSVIGDFGLTEFFDDIIESAVVGIRKPDPAIFALGVERIGLPAEHIVVIGDSYSKDIVPARKNGCQTIWLKGPGWGDDDADATADVIITDFMELKSIFQID
ncbi:MAG TPA: HAD family hydrolase [Dysgonomonas sp.]|nr:HAD family hydrolase [Dysgonomonas sp.]